MPETTYDIAIIGGGPGGYVSAIRGAQLGKKVVLIEGDEVGGTCLLRGCIPTKTLIKAGELASIGKKAALYGIDFSPPEINLEKLRTRKNTVIKTLTGGVKALLKGNGIELIKGVGSFRDASTIEVITPEGNKQIKAEKIIIASGSIPTKLNIPGIDLDCVIDSDTALELESIPEKLVIVGGGVIGVEMAYIYRCLGSDVEIVELLPRIIANEDSDVSQALAASLTRLGIKIHTGVKVISIEKSGEKAITKFEDNEGSANSLESNLVLIGVGRTPNTSKLKLENVGIETSGAAIKVNEKMETSTAGIYAIGDAVGGFMLAHVAMEEGIVAVENAAGKDISMRYDHIPRCIYTLPEVACAGICEDEAQKQGIEIKVGKFPFSASGKAATMVERDGFVKIISSAADDRIIGVSIVGAEATELIAVGVIAIKEGLKSSDIGGAIHAHPTLSEAIKEAALAINGKAIHMPPRQVKRN
ncbi:MAG: dihydrolipoyl dehydrogenase [Candidatus Schekmanbacteria bacterium]|nr:MAG: dihydrolipoyl dehydrogenase [Candidatus Schekmanbacteria bacterium]